MERPTKVIPVSDTPPVPRRGQSRSSEILKKQKEQLALSPDILVVDNSYPRATRKESLQSAKNAMYQLNSGQRKAFPSDTYYAIWRWSPDSPDTAQILVGLRTHIKEEWIRIVNRAGSRKASRSDEKVTGETQVVDAAFEEKGEPEEDSE